MGGLKGATDWATGCSPPISLCQGSPAQGQSGWRPSRTSDPGFGRRDCRSPAHPHAPVSQLLGDEQVPQVVLGRALVVLQQRVRVAQAVASLCLHRLVLELPGQLQRLPAGQGVRAPLMPLPSRGEAATRPEPPAPRSRGGLSGPGTSPPSGGQSTRLCWEQTDGPPGLCPLASRLTFLNLHMSTGGPGTAARGSGS